MIASAEPIKRWLIEYIQGIVAHPDQVDVQVESGSASVVYRVSVADEDVGQVKGQQGSVVQALSSVIEIAGTRDRVRHVVDLVSAEQDKDAAS